MIQQIRLMIVDDHKLFRDGLKAIFSKYDEIKVVCEANDGIEAVEMLKSNEVDVLITDISMPNMNGAELTKYLAVNYPEISILALTMHNDIANIDMMLNAGAKGYLLKNSGRVELVQAVKSLSSGKEFFSDEVREQMLKTYIKAKSETVAIKNDKGVMLFTRREREMIMMMHKGLTNNEIAEKLTLSVHTVGTHKKNIYSKMGVVNFVGFLEYITENKLIS